MQRLRVAFDLAKNPRSSVGRVLQTGLTNIVLAGLTVVTGSLAARVLGPTGRGHLALIQIWPLVLIKIAHLGLPDALVYFVAREPGEEARYTGTGMGFSLGISAFIGAGAYFLMPVILYNQPDTVVEVARVYGAVFFPLVTLMNFPLATFRGLNSFGRWNVLTLAQHVAWLAVLVVAWISDQSTFSFVAYGYILSLPVLTLLNHRLLIRRIGSYAFDASRLGRLLRFGFPSALSNTSEILNMRIDQVFLALFVEPRLLGLYVAASAWSLASRPLLSAVSTVLFPRVAMDATSSQQVETFAAGVRATVAVASALTVVLVALTPLAVPMLFGDAFAPAVPAALLLVMGGSLRGLNGVIEDGLRGLGKPKLPMVAELLGVATTLTAAIVLIGPFSITGVAAASILGYAVTTVVLVRSFITEERLRVRQLLAPDFGFLRDSLQLIVRRTTATRP